MSCEYHQHGRLGKGGQKGLVAVLDSSHAPPPSIYLESRMCMVWFCVRVPASPALHVVEHVNVRVLTARDQRERPAVDLRPNPVPLARGAAAKEDS